MAGIQDFLGGGSGIGGMLGDAALSAATGLVRKALPQTSAMMALGLFVFSLHTIPYQQLQRQTQWRHPSTSRVGMRPARQFVGPGDDTITLSGTLLPEITGGAVSLALLRTLAGGGKAWPLIQGNGTFYGHFVIESVDETASLFFSDGAARRIDFSVKLVRVDDNAIDMLGSVTKDLLAMLP